MSTSVCHEASSEANSDDEDAEAESADCTLIVTETSQAPTHHHCFIPLPGAKSKVWKYFAFEQTTTAGFKTTVLFLPSAELQC